MEIGQSVESGRSCVDVGDSCRFMHALSRRSRISAGYEMSPTTLAPPSANSAPPSPYIVGPAYDWCLFLLPPVISLLIGIGISDTAFTQAEFDFHDYDVTAAGLLIGIVIHAHLFIVFFRSHGNGSIFDTHRVRFVTVPLLLFTAMVLSSWTLVFCSVLATFWDVYHSGLQTFGFGRLYDKKQSNSPEAGRSLDFCLNSLLYAGPIVAGVTMMDHFEDFDEFEEVGVTFFTHVPAFMDTYHAWFAYGVVGFGTLFTAYYLYAYLQLQRQGYRVSWPKTWLYVSTGLTSVYTWGFNSFGEAFFIMNLFHAVQYFGLIWWSEKRSMARLFGVAGLRLGMPITFALFVGTASAYGYFVEWMDTDLTPLFALTLTVSLMHFWYDGFIWSVRKKQI